jgi:hypothetical protein
MGNTYVYVGKKRKCGCVVDQVVDDPENTTNVAVRVAEMIGAGLVVERHSHKWGDKVQRVHGMGCVHEYAMPTQSYGTLLDGIGVISPTYPERK